MMSPDSSPFSTMSAGALAGFKVIDLTRVLGGPYCTMILADHGAEVIKVEPPQGDETRDWGPPFNEEGESAYYQGVNRNKRSIGLDLASEAGKAVLGKLLEDADVLIENFKPGTLEKWGLGYKDVLAERFPRLVHCRVTGFGADGPLGGFPGYDAVIQAMSGMMSVNGSPESGPVRVGTPMVDMGTGLNAAIAILMALLERGKSGKGQFLDITLYDSAVALLHPQGNNYLMSGKPPVITGNAHPNVYPYDVFPTKDKDLFLAVGNNGQFKRLADAIEAPELADDPRFKDNADRSSNRDALKALLAEKLAQYECEPLALGLLQKGVPAGPVNTIPDVMEHPHTIFRQMRVGAEDGYGALGVQAKLSRTPGGARSGPPKYGSATRAVLAEAGISADEVESLINDGVALVDRRK
ncbi:MAG: CoA transferase [Alphaproteobacteria bacterium]|nr:CoA transferase [Alphaproteobacteria bacterium]